MELCFAILWQAFAKAVQYLSLGRALNGKNERKAKARSVGFIQRGELFALGSDLG